MQTTVVNVRKRKGYIRMTTDDYAYIGRPSIFGNPFEIGKDGDRRQVVEKYKVWFYKRLEDPSFYQEVWKLKGKSLGCWCAPLLCHGNVIAEYLDGGA